MVRGINRRGDITAKPNKGPYGTKWRTPISSLIRLARAMVTWDYQNTREILEAGVPVPTLLGYLRFQ